MAHDDLTMSASGLSRRTFLTAGAALIGSAMLLQPNAAAMPTALANLAKLRGPRVSIGFIANSAGATTAEMATLLADGGARIAPATALRSGGASLRGGAAKVHLGGLGQGFGPDAAIRGAQLDALLQTRGAETDRAIPFYAWTLNRDQGDVGSPDVSFVVPFEREPTMGLQLRTRTGEASPTSWVESTTVLTGGADRGLAKLREGTYLVGLEQGTWDKARVLPPLGDARWNKLTSLALSVRPA